DLASELDLLGIRLSQLTLAGPEAIFQADADVRSHGSGLCRDPQLACAGAKRRPPVAFPEKSVGGAFHMGNIFRMCTDATKEAENGLNEERRFDQITVGEMS